MPVLYRASFGYLLRHPWQLGLTLLGICIGVAVMVAVDLANDSARKAFLLSMNTVNGAATHQIVAGPNGVDERLYVALRVDEGVRNISPVVDGYVDVGSITLQLLGIDVFAEREFRDYTIPGNDESWIIAAAPDGGSAADTVRRIMTEPGAVLLSENTASLLQLETHDRFDVMASGKSFPAVLVGLLEGASALDNLVIADISVAQKWLNQYGTLSRIDVRIPAGNEQANIERIRSILPPDTKLLSAEGRTQSVTSMSAAFMTNLTAMSLLALLVGIFLIYNSVGFAVLQRRGLIGVLRALGLTRKQAFVLILQESLLLGVVGASLGVITGIWLGEQLLGLVSRSINDLYFVVRVTDVELGPASVAKGLAAGLGATVIAAIVPAIEASSYQPRLAMTRSVLERRAGGLLLIIAFVGVAAAAFAIVLLAVSGKNLVAGLAALFLLILGTALCVPIGVKWLSNFAAPAAAKLGGITARLAVTGVAATLSRTGVAIVALAVAVSASIGVSIMVDSFRGSVSDWLGNTLRSDIYVGVTRGQLDAGLINDLVHLPGVAEYSASRRIWLESESGRTRIIALEMASQSYAGTRILDGNPEEVWQAFDEQGAVLVSEPFAYRNNVELGDTVALNTANGVEVFPIAAVYQSYDRNQGSVLMSRDSYQRAFQDAGIDAIGLYLDADASAAAVTAALHELAAGRQAVLVRSNEEIREQSLQIFDRTFIITDVLYWLAVGVAIIGILGAMLALQLERARELAVLRAVGMTPAQLGGMVTLQSGFIGLLSGLAAIPLGIVMAGVLILVINRRAFGWQMDITVSARMLLIAVVLSVGAALIAGIYPAYRAANNRPAVAMREE
ncbi:MAG: FtsX-like permease family protein [Woeseia sp.]